MNTAKTDDAKRRELARIHIAATQLGMDTRDRDPDSDYRSMLWTIGRVRSAAELDAAGRRKVLDHLRARGWQPVSKKSRRKRFPGRPHNTDSRPLLRKIEALLADARLPWSYADSIGRRMGFSDRIAFCSDDQLRRVVAALEYRKRRGGHGRA